MKVCFGEFTFDGARQELQRQGERVHLTPKVMRLLELFIERRGTVLTHAEIHDHLWPDVVVSEANLKNVVSALRSALDDHERQGDFIRNVYDRGYQFTDHVIEVERPERPAVRGHLRIDQRLLPLHEGETVVGRDADCAIRVEDVSVSRHHAKITVSSTSIVLEDLGSKNGTFVDGGRVDAPQQLTGVHKILFGGAIAWFSWGPGAPATSTLPTSG